VRVLRAKKKRIDGSKGKAKEKPFGNRKNGKIGERGLRLKAVTENAMIYGREIEARHETRSFIYYTHKGFKCLLLS